MITLCCFDFKRLKPTFYIEVSSSWNRKWPYFGNSGARWTGALFVIHVRRLRTVTLINLRQPHELTEDTEITDPVEFIVSTDKQQDCPPGCSCREPGHGARSDRRKGPSPPAAEPGFRGLYPGFILSAASSRHVVKKIQIKWTDINKTNV